ncbi:transporter [Bradyrhizobium sp. 30]|uniref:transporter n=1 Tax=Bradyrhizobium sp. 30 TaxID=2782669 RepID=UPI00321192F0
MPAAGTPTSIRRRAPNYPRCSDLRTTLSTRRRSTRAAWTCISTGGASQFLTKQVQVGLVGYAYKELGCDSGSGDRVGCFLSQVFGVGPQFGYVFPLSEGLHGYVNLKGYAEFGGAARPTGWNSWLTFAISPAAAPPPPGTSHDHEIGYGSRPHFSGATDGSRGRSTVQFRPERGARFRHSSA